jgi:hypothetical protein
MSIRRPPSPRNPALRQHAKERTQHVENRIADAITQFAGSMLFVYLHIIWLRPGSSSASRNTPSGYSP